MRPTLYALLLCACSSLSVTAQETVLRVETGWERVPWSKYDGQVVTVEGLVWGIHSKGLGAHVVLASPNPRVYLEASQLSEKMNGRLCRVHGVLHHRIMKKAPKGAQGYSNDFDYYAIKVYTLELIDQVQSEQLLLSDDEWVRPGMGVAEVKRLMKEHAVSPYEFEANNPNGGVPLSYLIKRSPDGKCSVLVLHHKDDQVQSLNLLETNGLLKAPINDQSSDIPAFRLPLKR